MRRYVRLSEEGRTSRRTIADALEVLRDKADFAENDRAGIIIGLLNLPSAEAVGLVQIVFDAPVDNTSFIVSLPTSKHFQAYCGNARQRERFDVAKLHGAVLDDMGNVWLADGLAFRAVEVIPARLPLEPTKLDRRIIHHTLSIIRADQCYRPLAHGLPPDLQQMVAELGLPDCSTFAALPLPPLKVLSSRIRERDWTLRKLSEQQVADTLRKFGVRIPRPRSRSNAATH
jgi:hypothetical protein